MALPSLATTQDLEDRLGRSLTPAEVLRAEGDLADASALVRIEAGLTWTTTDGELDDVLPDIVVSVVLSVARRRFENPGGYVSETVGPFAYRLAGGDEHAGLFLTPGERRAIRSLRRSAGFVSVPMRTAYYVAPDPTILPLP